MIVMADAVIVDAQEMEESGSVTGAVAVQKAEESGNVTEAVAAQKAEENGNVTAGIVAARTESAVRNATETETGTATARIGAESVKAAVAAEMKDVLSQDPSFLFRVQPVAVRIPRIIKNKK